MGYLHKPENDPDTPLKVAWARYQVSLTYKPVLKYCVTQRHVEGAMYAAFYAGFHAGRGENEGVRR